MNPIGEFILTLLHAVTNTHILHWKALVKKNYPEHVILGEFYPDLDKLVDTLMESMIGGYDILPDFPAEYYRPASTSIDELTELKEFVKENRHELPNASEIQNLVDNIAALLNQTIALLRSSPEKN
jgi:hypothetical protein